MLALNNLTKNRIVNGRLFIYEQDTSVLADVYTYEDGSFTHGPNPIYFVDGISDNTYFVGNNIYDCVAEEYHGGTADPQGDLRPEVWDEAFSTKIGFSVEEGGGEATIVHGIDGLKAATPSGYVTVVGYWTDSDCPARTYWFDENAIDNDDGGLIIRSNSTDTGRWVMIVGDSIPSQYYGVYGTDHQENLLNLLAAPRTYGSQNIYAPSKIVMAPLNGTASTDGYGNGYSIYNAYGKTIEMLNDARFKKGNIIKCNKVIGNGQLGDFQLGFAFNGAQEANLTCQEARMSNFYSLQRWFECGARSLIMDVPEYDWQWGQYDNTFSAEATLYQRNIKFETPFRITSQNGAYPEFNQCTFIGDPNFNFAPLFKNMKVTDKWYTSPTYFYGRGADQSANNWQNCSASDNDFVCLENLFYYGKAIGKSAYDCSNKSIRDSSVIFIDNPSTILVNNLNNTSGTKNLILSSDKTIFNNCTLDNNFRIYSRNVTANNCTFNEGYWIPVLQNYAAADCNMYGYFNNCYFNNEWNNYVSDKAQSVHVTFRNSDISFCSGALLSDNTNGWSGDNTRVSVTMDGCSIGIGAERCVVSSNIRLTGIAASPTRFGSFVQRGDNDFAEKYVWKIEPWNTAWCSAANTYGPNSAIAQPTWSQGGTFYIEGNGLSYTVSTGWDLNGYGNIRDFTKRKVNLNWTNPPQMTQWATSSQVVNLVRY